MLCHPFREKTMPALAALLFDVDGTLADTEEIHRQCFNQAFADAGLDWTWSIAVYGELLAVTGGRERILHYINTQRPVFTAPADLKQWITELHLAKTALYTRRLAEGRIPLRPGVSRLIDEARRAGLRLAIVTTTTPANVIALLEHSLHRESPGWFEVIAAGDMVPAKKPAPDIYRYALHALKLDATQCLSFEDSENGVHASRGAGIATVVTLNDYTRDHDFSGALILLDTLGEPDEHCQVLSDASADVAYVDVALLRSLHAKAYK